MASLQLFGFQTNSLIGIIGNVHIMNIVSLIISVAIDFFNIGTSEMIELDLSSLFIIAHSSGFLVYQIIHLLVGKVLLNWVENLTYKPLAILECLQAYFTIMYFYNPIATAHWTSTSAEIFFEIFLFFTTTLKYSVYIFLCFSIITAAVMMFSSEKPSESPKKDQDSEQVFGMSYETCDWLIFLLSFLSFIPTCVAFLIDILFLINDPTIRKPTDSQWSIGAHYCVMGFFQYCRFVFLSLSDLSTMTEKWLILEISQFVIYSALFFNPYRGSDKEIFEIFKYTTITQSLAIFVLFFSFGFNTLVFYLTITPEDVNEEESEEKGSEEEADGSEEDSEKDSEDDHDDDEYEVIDGTEESSTKDEIHEHPKYWLRRKPKKHRR